MKLSSSRLFKTLFGLIAAAAIGGPAIAQTVETPLFDHSRFYVGGDVGAIIPQDMSYTASVPIIGTLKTTVSGHISFNTGAAAGLSVGYHVNDWLALQGDFEYANLDYNKMTASIALLPTLPLTFGISGHSETYSFLANAIITNKTSWNGLTPYVGAGVGVSDVESSFSSITFAGITVPVSDTHSEADLAADAMIGVNYRVTPQIILGARYRLLYIDKANDDLISGTGGSTSYGSLWGHVLTVTAAYHF